MGVGALPFEGRAVSSTPMPLHFGSVGCCHYNVITAPADDQVWNEFVERMLQLAEIVQPGDVVIDLWHAPGGPSSVQRDRFNSAFNASPSVRLVKAHAFVATSTLARGALTAINWVIKRPFEEKTFARPAEGIAWLHAQQPAVDVAALERALQEQVPGFAALRW